MDYEIDYISSKPIKIKLNSMMVSNFIIANNRQKELVGVWLVGNNPHIVQPNSTYSQVVELDLKIMISHGNSP